MAKKRQKQPRFPPDLFTLMEGFDSDSLPDFAWEGVLRDAVHFYNAKNSTNFDPNEALLAYIDRQLVG